MADENIPALAPTRSDDQILPFAMWVPIGKSNHVVDLQKRQKNLIFQISMDILQNTNFFRAFTASASVPAIYIQQFWNTLTYEEKYCPMINNCLQAKTLALLGHDIQFFRSLREFPTKKGRKDKPHVIPYCRFTKLIIYHLGRIHNIHQRSASPFHLAEEDLRLGNLKFVSKGKVDEVFGMPISNELISINIKNAPYYNAYLEMSKPAIEKSSNPAPAPNPKVTKEKPSKASLDNAAQAMLSKKKSTIGYNHYKTLLTTEPELEHHGKAYAEIGAELEKSNSKGDIEMLQITKELGEDVDKHENVKEKIVELDQDQA
ncbi:hypothetical protein Tco_0688543 [Tanacetum coccineum]